MLKILFIGLVWPEPQSSAAGWRILQLIRLFGQAYEVHFASAAAKSPYSFQLDNLGVIEHQIQLNDSSFDDFIQQLSPSVVIFDRFMVEEQYGWRVAEFCPQALRILDTEDLHFIRLARQEAFKKKQALDLFSATAKREIASILRSDLSLIISKTEIQTLQDTFDVSAKRLFYIPFQEESLTEKHKQHLPAYKERAHYAFIGNFIHEPNWRTVEVLKKDIWPILRKKNPQAELHIYGAYATEKVFQLGNEREKFIIKGRAEDARAMLQNYRVLLAPIPFGAGTKGKFVDAMYAGTPSMSSKIGAEDMQLAGGWNGFIEDDKEEFARLANQLYNDEKEWYEAQAVGFEIFNNSFANTTYSENLLNWVKDALERIPEIRQTNFIGQILLQQALNATKYMAMWIEAKNKH